MLDMAFLPPRRAIVEELPSSKTVIASILTSSWSSGSSFRPAPTVGLKARCEGVLRLGLMRIVLIPDGAARKRTA